MKHIKVSHDKGKVKYKKGRVPGYDRDWVWSSDLFLDR